MKGEGQMAGYSVGIDFGTCSIKVSHFDEKRNKVLQMKIDKSDNNADKKVPNVIQYTERNKFKVGEAARKAKVHDYKNVVELIKRKLELESWSHQFEKLGFELTATEIAEDIFRWIKKGIEEQGKSIENAVVTVPVCFTEIQKKRIICSAQNAGIHVADTITEPVAALFSIEELFEEECDENVVIFDFGGATLDLCLFHITNDGNGNICIHIETSCGINFGGVDITEMIYHDILHPKYEKELDAEIEQDVLHRLRSSFIDTTDKMKTELFASEEESYEDTFDLPYSSKILEAELTLEEVLRCFENHKVKDILWNVLDELFDDSSIEKEDVTMVKTFGGTSRILFFREILKEYFEEGVFDVDDYDSDEAYSAVADGAARYVSILTNHENHIEISNAIPFYVGIDKNGKFKPVIKRNQKYDVFTPYRQLKDILIPEESWNVILYQSFRADDISITGKEGAVYLGNIALNKELYGEISSVLYKFGINKSGKIVGRFFKIDEKQEPVLIEEKEIIIGG